jgi:hypothetical protein
VVLVEVRELHAGPVRPVAGLVIQFVRVAAAVLRSTDIAITRTIPKHDACPIGHTIQPSGLRCPIGSVGVARHVRLWPSSRLTSMFLIVHLVLTIGTLSGNTPPAEP